MIQNIKRYWYAIIINPLEVTMLTGFFALLIIFFLTYDSFWYILAFIYAIPFAILEKTLPKGIPKTSAVPLTSLFYGIRSPFSGRVTILQKRPDGNYDCHDLIRLILAQQSLLPAALIKKPGKYRAITHETIILRLQSMPEAQIENIKPIYQGNMSANLNYMTKKKCRRCQQPCPAAIGRRTERQFFDVKFSIK